MAVSGAKEFQVEAAPADVMAAIAAVDRLPEWSSAHKKVIVESTQQNSQDGSYTLTPNGDGTLVKFALTVDPKIPLPGFLLKKAQKMALETASQGLTKFVDGK